MSNIATVLKEEISRLARKEIKSYMDGQKKSSTQRRKDVVLLKREVAKLERQVYVLEKKVLNKTHRDVQVNADSTARFTPKGLKSQRKRLGLSATDYAKLAGVSSLSIYNWEKGTIHPRKSQIANLSALRSLGKKEAFARLGIVSKTKPGPKLGSKRNVAVAEKVVAKKKATPKKKAEAKAPVKKKVAAAKK